MGVCLGMDAALCGREHTPEYLVDIARYFGCKHPPNRYTTRLEPRISCGIPLGAIGSRVKGAVDFDHQRGFDAIEVGDVRSDWMLTTEAETAETLRPNMMPERGFGV